MTVYSSFETRMLQILNLETEFLMIKFKILPFRSFIIPAENKKPRGKS